MTSCFFNVSNGVRQGGILYNYLFAVLLYIMPKLGVTLISDVSTICYMQMIFMECLHRISLTA